MLRAKMFGSVLFLAVAACATAKPQQANAPAAQAQAKDVNGKVAEKEDPRIQCRMERPTGSNIPERVCRYVDIKQSEDAMRTQDMVRDAQSKSAPLQGN